MKKYNIGDTIYTAYAEHTQDYIECSVCAGTGKLMVKPAGADDSAGQAIVCHYCERNRDQTIFGKVRDIWSYKPIVRTIKIEGVSETNQFGKETQYKYMWNIYKGGHNFVDTEDRPVFGTFEEAEIEAKRLVDLQTEEGQARKRLIDFDDNKASWTVGYCKELIKDCKKKISDAKRTIKSCETSLKYAQKQLLIEE